MIARLNSERGASLVETLVAVAILATALVVLLAGLSSGSLATAQADRLSTAHELARSQMEYTKASPYNPSPFAYPTVVPPTGYEVSAAAEDVPNGDPLVQKITVEVHKDGALLYALEGLKVDR